MRHKVYAVHLYMGLVRTGLKPIGPIVPKWAPHLWSPVLELSTLCCSSTHNNTRHQVLQRTALIIIIFYGTPDLLRQVLGLGLCDSQILGVISTACICRCKSNYHTMAAMQLSWFLRFRSYFIPSYRNYYQHSLCKNILQASTTVQKQLQYGFDSTFFFFYLKDISKSYNMLGFYIC